MKIGIISDTHITNPNACDVPDWIINAFAGVNMIIHAGDVERPEYLHALKAIAPVYAVRGNCDMREFSTPETISVEIGCGLLTAAHRAPVARQALSSQSRVMVYGHTHISLINDEGGLLVINPGSPTLPRAGLPASVAVLEINGNELYAELKVQP
ncbi:MAG: metallophosphatase family protein [Candidatus Riflebacteria bacterium]|nr:metallophosphatase family protein [Candidatus Riflebacteria bacterium]